MHYDLLLIAHVICADRQIHSEEVRYLNALSKKNGADSTTIELVDKIFAQDENCPSVEGVAKNISLETRQEVFLQVLEVAHVDGNFSPLEQDIIDKIAEIWNLSESIEQISQTKQALEVKIVRQLQDTRMSLDSKARALSHFSITLRKLNRICLKLVN